MVLIQLNVFMGEIALNQDAKCFFLNPSKETLRRIQVTKSLKKTTHTLASLLNGFNSIHPINLKSSGSIFLGGPNRHGFIAYISSPTSVKRRPHAAVPVPPRGSTPPDQQCYTLFRSLRNIPSKNLIYTAIFAVGTISLMYMYIYMYIICIEVSTYS